MHIIVIIIHCRRKDSIVSLWVDAARAPRDNRLHYKRLSIVCFFFSS